MKRTFPILLLCLSLLTGCTPPAEPTPGTRTQEAPTHDPTGVPADSAPPSLDRDEVPDWVSCRIVDGAEEGELLLAELDYPLNDRELNHHDGKSVYRLSLTREVCGEEPGPTGETVAVTELLPISIYLDGEPAQPSDLKDGMNVELSFNGLVMESFPARLGEVWELHAYSVGTPQCPGGSYYDLCGLYLQVLDDLWEKDPGLNSNISTAGLDLSEAPGELLESEKAALAWRFGELHGVEVVRGTYETLAQEGYLTAVEGGSSLYQWKEGCLFTIRVNHDHDDETYFGLPVLFFDAQKWCSPLGAYYFGDCSAVWPETGTWSGYKIGHEAIS